MVSDASSRSLSKSRQPPNSKVCCDTIATKYQPFNKTIMEKTNLIGRKVIIRADRAGVFFGTLVAKNDTPAGVEVEMKDSRRIWYWDGAASLSQLAVDGTSNPNSCKFTVTVPQHVVMQVIEIIPCTDKAVKSIESVEVWKR